MKVKYLGCSEEQINWGGHDDPREILKIGSEYEVEDTEVHTWHTKIKLEGIDGRFNSVCFEDLDNL